MKYLIFALTFMATLPHLFASDRDAYFYLEGIWDGRDYNQHLDIQAYGKGIKVRKSGIFRKKRKFRSVGYNAFSDRDGNIIELQSDNRLVWRNVRKGSYDVFFKRNRYQRGYRDRYDRRRGYNDRDYRGHNYRQNEWGSLGGRWTCSAGRRNIFIESQEGGFRARKYDDDRWYDFTQDPYERNVYRCDNGEKYIWDDGRLTWFSRNGRDRIRFSRRRG